MNIEYLIQLLENKLIFLTNSKAQAFMIGDLSSINSYDVEIASINDTLYKLRLLLAATQAATSTNTDISTMLAAGIEAVKNTPIIPENATACMAEYDISTYATDPLHEQKIADILSYMGAMNSPADIDLYLNNEVVACPLTGSIIFEAAQEYKVDCRLLMAIMELDSRFGTVGIAVTTFNPGNVGNTGTATRTYSSWQAGVEAVASWLDKHRVNPLPITPEVVVPEPVVEEPIPIVPVVDTPPAEIVEPSPEIPPISTSTDPVIPPPVETPTSTEPIIVPPVDTVPTSTEPVLDNPVSKVKTKIGKTIAKANPLKIKVRKFKV